MRQPPHKTGESETKAQSTSPDKIARRAGHVPTHRKIWPSLLAIMKPAVGAGLCAAFGAARQTERAFDRGQPSEDRGPAFARRGCCLKRSNASASSARLGHILDT